NPTRIPVFRIRVGFLQQRGPPDGHRPPPSPTTRRARATPPQPARASATRTRLPLPVHVPRHATPQPARALATCTRLPLLAHAPRNPRSLPEFTEPGAPARVGPLRRHAPAEHGRKPTIVPVSIAARVTALV